MRLVKLTAPNGLPFWNEHWRPIAGFEGSYEVSDLGRVRALRYGGRAEPRILDGHRHTTGYRQVRIGGTLRSVHRLVLEAFVGPCPLGLEASHLRGTAEGDRLDNLIWESRTENNRRKAAHGTLPTGDRSGPRRHPERMPHGDRNGSRLHPERLRRGESHPAAKLTAEQVRAIRTAAAQGERHKDIGLRHGISQRSVWDIVIGRTWRHVGAEVAR